MDQAVDELMAVYVSLVNQSHSAKCEWESLIGQAHRFSNVRWHSRLEIVQQMWTDVDKLADFAKKCEDLKLAPKLVAKLQAMPTDEAGVRRLTLELAVITGTLARLVQMTCKSPMLTHRADTPRLPPSLSPSGHHHRCP
jgi:hypothetical protein